MRYIVIILIALTISCGTDQRIDNKMNFTVVNETGGSLKILSYLSDRPEETPLVINFDENESITRTFDDPLIPNVTYTIGNFFGTKDQSRDSIKVVRNNSEFLLYKAECSEDAGNPLNLCRDLGSSNHKVFTFYEANFSEARQCDGNCF